MSSEKRRRLDPAVFRLPEQLIRDGHYSDKYFVRTRDVLLADGRDPVVLMQVFCKSEAMLAGVDEALAILRRCSADWTALTVRALHDGDPVTPWETVLTIEGRYSAFAHLETLYLGVLARRTRVASNTRAVVDAANGKEVLFFPARHDHWTLQEGDGYAAHLGGAVGVSTDAQASWWGGRGLGTVPHALIGAYGGDTVLATQKLAEHLEPEVRLVSLVDYDNDCVATSVAVAEALGERLHGVRLDTSNYLVDRSVLGQMGDFDPRGVNPVLIRNVREALDSNGFADVRIVVSGGLTAERIRGYEALALPTDSYGVGSAMLDGQGSFDFTADIVKVDGEPCAKVGRRLRPNDRLEAVD